ncbi:hypothetical protein BCR36DRAFT_313616, partial [Piromyces finnis]
EPNEALAGIIIFTNCTDSVKRYIMNCESAYEKMEKLKSLYKLDDSSNHGEINKYHHRNNKYCIICNISGHSVKDCHYNPCRPTRTKKNETHPNKQAHKTFSYKREANEDKYCSNIENNETTDSIPCYEELNTMFGPTADNIESKIKSNEKMDDPNISNPENESSEHITNNKEILKNFIDEKIIMNFTNKSSCIFEIVLDKVLYSKDVNKNLISGIKLTKSGISTQIKNNNNQVFLTLFDIQNNEISNHEPDINSIIRIKFINTIQQPNHIKIINQDPHDCSKNNYSQSDSNKQLVFEAKCNGYYLKCKVSKLKSNSNNNLTTNPAYVLKPVYSDTHTPSK